MSTGLYGIVRHPMYLGALVMMVGTPLALDSLLGAARRVVPALPMLAARILDEEKLLVDELAGYREYTDAGAIPADSRGVVTASTNHLTAY